MYACIMDSIKVSIQVKVDQFDPPLSFKAEPSDNVENEANFVIVDYLYLINANA